MSELSYTKAFGLNFLGNSPNWYKLTIIAFLIINPIIAFAISPVLAGWFLVIEFIFTLAMALKCYPLQPGGLLAVEACFIGLCEMGHVREEIEANLEVLLLLMFMVAGIHFIRDLLLFIFTKLFVKVRSHILQGLIFCFMGAFLSAFLDALTVLAVMIAICTGIYAMYKTYISGDSEPTHISDDRFVRAEFKEDQEKFRAYLRSMLMHSAVGTALGGVCTLVGEPQNLIVGAIADWPFMEFAIRVSPVSMPTLACGLLTCFIIEKFHLFGFGQPMPDSVYNLLVENDKKTSQSMTRRDSLKLWVQAICAVWLIIGLAFHLAAVGLIGLSIIIFATAFCGITSEEQIGHAFTESLPFCSLLCVFFAVVTVIAEQKMFVPLINWVLERPPEDQLPIFYLANGVLSAVSDNVFVATIYIQEVHKALEAGIIGHEEFNHLAVAINTGTNLPSVATPNGQAAFLFLLTSAISPLIKLPYLRMVYMALPYTVVLTIVGLIGTWYFLPPITDYFIEQGILLPHGH